MSHQEEESEGTGLSAVFDILVKAPPERLQSLTLQLGESPEDNIIRILCLVVLRREAEARNKIQELGENRIVDHLSEKLQSGGNLEDFGVHCGRFEDLIGEASTLLARIFKVLSEQRLCDARLCHLAYRRALSANGHRSSSSEHVEFSGLVEEARVVCGPQVAESMSPKDLKSEPYHDPHRSLNGGNITLDVSLPQSDRAHSPPSPLQAGSLEEASYPSHLEISLPPTASYKGDERVADISDESKVIAAKKAPGPAQPFGEAPSKPSEPTQSEAKKTSVLDAASANRCTRVTAPAQNTQPSRFSPPSLSNALVPHKTHESTSAEEEDEAIFYAFVILHAPQDVDKAEDIKARMEAVTGSRGAVFSEDFALPGRSTLRCVEDAINNSAFVFLLLTCNFNTRLLELKTDSALINSINNEHKYNTVIPLLPRENCMPQPRIPMVLSTLISLKEDKRFEVKIKRVISQAKINKLKRIWTEEQKVKRQLERQDVLKQLNKTRKHLIDVCKTAEYLERENLRLKELLLVGGEKRGDDQARPQSIHINNARYIMIGNDSQMNVDYGGAVDEDDDADKDQEEEGSSSESA